MGNRGITLFETLIAVLLIAVLIGVFGARYKNTKRTLYQTYVQAELRDLITAQEAYYQTSGSAYAETLAQLAFVTRPEVTIELDSNGYGWAARGSSIELPSGYFCAVFVGDIEAPPPADDEGEIACLP
jgi:Tfp pilus assembly protein PilE